MKRLIGWTGPPVEEAVQKLEKLAQEEALMVAPENLLITRQIDNGVKGVQENLKGVDQSIETVDLKVQVLDDKMRNVKDELHGVGGRVDLVLESEHTFLASPFILTHYSDSWQGDISDASTDRYSSQQS